MENKPVLVYQAPVGTRSGYGERSRDLLRSLIALDKYDIKVVSTRWGNTPMNVLTEADQDILSRILTQPLNAQPEIFMQVTVPNEFQPIGKFNIGITAGIETDACDHSWIEGCNRMDLILTSSKHSKKVFESTTFEKRDQHTNQVIGQLRLEKPVEVLLEGVRLDIFNKTYSKSETVEELMSQVKETFAFLFVGHWLPGDMGEDRKNVGALVRTFFEAFKNKTTAPALILKTSGGSISVMDRAEIVKRINLIKQTVEAKSLPNVYLAYGDFSDAEMNDLYNHPKIKCHVSLTKGEGFGRPLIEAATTNKPIIASNWSGHLDFLNEDFSILIPGTLTNVHPSAAWPGVLNQEAKWFTVDYGKTMGWMREVFKDYKTYSERSRKMYHIIKSNFSMEKMTEKLNEILTRRIPEFPKQVQLQLPKLKKIDSSTSSAPMKIELPKLKKVDITK